MLPSTRIFKFKGFSRFAEKNGIQDSELKHIVHDVLESERACVNLGGGVFKVRLARRGEGKSSGYRIIVFFKSSERTFFHYGFAKSERDNISRKELEWFKELAIEALTIGDEQIEKRLKSGSLQEIT